tara:strand:- start:3130 stop:3885 length:756 start_codon:yes stop_codon:yes gene_type:complete
MKKLKEKQGSILNSQKQFDLNKHRADYFDNSFGSSINKINSLTRFMNRQDVAKLIAQKELLTKTKGTLGDIIEAGVYFGSGLMGWGLLLATLEPYNYQCKVVGFDTFEGTKGVTPHDQTNKKYNRYDGEYKGVNYEDLQKSIKLFDVDRPVNHIEKIKLVKGDCVKTSPDYVKENPECNVRILHLSMNIYKPTAKMLEVFLPRMSKGSLVVIDGLNHATAGCYKALKEKININKIHLKNIDYFPNYTYFEL